MARAFLVSADQVDGNIARTGRRFYSSLNLSFVLKRHMPQLIPQERGRRSSRVLVSLALAVSGQKSDGSHVSGAAETILVNRHGAEIRSAVPLEPKMEVRVAMLAPYKWRVGQVVWADSGEREYGIELYRPENFWGIYFPPEDWELGVPAVTVASAATVSGANHARVGTQPETSEASRKRRRCKFRKAGLLRFFAGLPAMAFHFRNAT